MQPQNKPFVALPRPKAIVTKASDAKPAPTAKEVLSAKAAKAAAKQKAAQAASTEAQKEAQQTTTFDDALLAATWEEAKAALQQAAERALDLVEAWIARPNAAAIAAIAESNDVAGQARKAARRALNVLKSRGVEIPERPRIALVETRDGGNLEATLIPPDPTGAYAVSITKRDSSGRYHIAEVIARDPIGIINAGSAWLSGSQIKEGRQRALDGLGIAPVPVPIEWARHRIATARKQNAASGQILPLALERCIELIEPVPDAEPAHPVADLEDSITSEAAWARVPGSMALHEEPEFRSWMPDRGSLEELLMKVGQRLGGGAVNDPVAVDQALHEEIEMATDRFFSPELRSVLSSRMRDAAISVRARKGDARATDVLAVARAMREAGLITSPPREIPFLVAFFQKGVSVLAQQGGGALRVPIPAPPPGAAAAEPSQAEGTAEATG